MINDNKATECGLVSVENKRRAEVRFSTIFAAIDSIFFFFSTISWFVREPINFSSPTSYFTAYDATTTSYYPRDMVRRNGGRAKSTYLCHGDSSGPKRGV